MEKQEQERYADTVVSPPAPSTGWAAVVDVAVPGSAPVAAGVLLVDASTGEYLQRFRPDLPDLDPDNADILEELPDDLQAKAREFGGERLLDWLESSWSGFLRVTDREAVALGSEPKESLRWYYHRHVRPRVQPYRTHLPLCSLRAAAGRWGPEREVENEPEEWVEAPGLRRLTEDMFVARVTGRSMEPLIPANSLCVFRGGAAVAGSRSGKRVLVANFGEPGEQRFTVKRYESVTVQVDEERREHKKVILHPLNPEFESWEIDYEPFELESSRRIQVIAEFVAVLEDY
ncbi:MAG TPA: S24 family peptidase [Bryobacteraceae bacterium]|nr:S24 family peptidase [Bryobacteraceae bacterium]